ncbi:MAG: 50S ribosomal protein L5 [Candidatus Bathyarchaeota archaeon]|jgi:large subunit ribosomal protein L5|nr:50S ribosomal protein L5 [Candidatus Bathyarchaeota archaeon]|tara:strand:+ start:581 stop:1387 length:807 start_codon:yes stop_codon:yes gene_type:complete
MTKEPSKLDNQVASEETIHKISKVRVDETSLSVAQPKTKAQKIPPEEFIENDLVEIVKPESSNPEELVINRTEVVEVQSIKEKPYNLPSKTRNSRVRSSMQDLMIGKVVVNITVGASGEPLDRAMTILESLTNQKPVFRRAKQTIRAWGVRRNEPIACMVTLRREKAEALLKKTFPAVGNLINPRSFDMQGNFAFGIREHIDIPGQRYNPNLGIVGMDIMATVERPGYRVSRRRRAKSSINQSHRVTKEESIEFIKQSFGVQVGLPDE